MENKLELVSEKIHEMWTYWATEMLLSEPNISSERRERWEKECFKPYSELSEEMKELDRRFAKIIINIIEKNE